LQKKLLIMEYKSEVLYDIITCCFVSMLLTGGNV